VDNGLESQWRRCAPGSRPQQRQALSATLKTLTVFRSILERAEWDEEITRNPIPLMGGLWIERRDGRYQVS
jgi:hypothetical protein